MSSIQGLLSEIRPNLEIIQVIKAADQLYYKDKVLYTDIKPEFLAAAADNTGKKGEQQQKKKETDRPTQQQQQLRTSEDAPLITGDNNQHQQRKKDKKGKKAGKGGGQQTVKAEQQSETEGESRAEGAASKLQQVIEQAKKTVEQALNIGGGSSNATSESTSNLAEELKLAKVENMKLHQKLETQEKRMAKLERINKKLLASAGLTESDFSD